MTSALITGVAGQDGAYLAELLLSKGYVVTGIARHASERNTWRINGLLAKHADRFRVYWGDVLDPGFVARCLDRAHPMEIYNLAAQSDVAASFDTPDYTLQVNALGTARLLEALRSASFGGSAQTRFYQASTSELFGDSPAPQSEATPFRPMSPYAAAKCAAFWMVRTYREAYGMHASNGILFNHESPLRAECFVTRKIAMAVAHIAFHFHNRTLTNAQPLVLGNLDARRDWGHAKDFVRGMWMMLQQPKADDYVLATGEANTVRDFVEVAFIIADVPLQWDGDVGMVRGRVVVKTDSQFRRPLDVPALCGDFRKARAATGWRPEISFHALVKEMVDAERKKLSA